MRVIIRRTNEVMLREGEYTCSRMRVSAKPYRIAFATGTDEGELLVNVLASPLRHGDNENKVNLLRKSLTNLGVKTVSDFSIDYRNEFWLLDKRANALFHLSNDLESVLDKMPCKPDTIIGTYRGTAIVVLADREGLTFLEGKQKLRRVHFRTEIAQEMSKRGVSFLEVSEQNNIYIKTAIGNDIMKLSPDGHLQSKKSISPSKSGDRFISSGPFIFSMSLIEDGNYLLLLACGPDKDHPFRERYIKVVDKNLREVEQMDTYPITFLESNGRDRIYFDHIELIVKRQPFAKDGIAIKPAAQFRVTICEANLILENIPGTH